MGQDSNNALIQQLKKHYDLDLDLFSSESGFFFNGAQRQHNLETLRHLSSFGDMVLFLTGDKGSGKTSLLNKLQTSNHEGLNILYLDADRFINKGQGHSGILFVECARLLGLNLKESLPPLELLPLLLKECHKLFASDGSRTLFAFDNADKVSKKDIQVFFGFCRDLPPESPLVMLFAGSSALLQWSKSGSNLDQNSWCHQIQLKPLSQSDVKAYLEEALVAANANVALELSEHQLQQLSELGKGLPGRINKLFPSVVLEPGLLKIPSGKKKGVFPLYVFIGLACLLTASFVFVSFQHGLFDKIVPVFSLDNSTKSAADSSSDEVLQISEAGEINLALQQKSRLAMLDGVLKEKGLLLLGDKKVHESSFVINSNDSENTVSLVDDSTPSSVLSDKKSSPVLIKEVPPEDEKLGDSGEPDQGVNVDIGKDNNQLLSEVKGGGEKLRGETPVVEELALHENFKSKAWLLEQPISSYMPQILGSYQEETAQKFISKIGKQKFEVYYLKTEHKGKPWFVVFYGVYPAKTHAQDAIKNAPKVIRNQTPWIRKASDVLSSYP